MKVKRRRKVVRMRGSRTHKRGTKNRTRGSGNRGGVGMSGTGKRGDQKKTLILNEYGNSYFRKDQLGAGTRKKTKIPSISLRTISEQISGLMRKGKAKDEKGIYTISLNKYKIIGDTDVPFKVKIHARAASPRAIEMVKKAGGEIILE